MRFSMISAAVVALTIGSPALAVRPVPINEPGSRHVAYMDLDLTTDSGVDSLFYRVRRAARSVCETDASRDLLRRGAEQKCFDEAITDAKTQMEGVVAVAVGRMSSPVLATAAK